MKFSFNWKWLLSIGLGLFAACQQDATTSRSPEEVVRQYQAFLDKNEFDKAKKISTPEGKEILEGLKVFFSGPAGDSTMVHTDFLSIACEEMGTTARCTCQLKDEYETYESVFKLQKMDGRWLVDTNDEGVIIKQSESEELIEEDTTQTHTPY
mgnify:CR=1 FL=1